MMHELREMRARIVQVRGFAGFVSAISVIVILVRERWSLVKGPLNRLFMPWFEDARFDQLREFVSGFWPYLRDGDMLLSD